MKHAKIALVPCAIVAVAVLATLFLRTTLVQAAKTSSSDMSMSGKCGVWSVVPSPNAGKSDNSLGSVAAIFTNDIWTVGMFIQSGTTTISSTLTEHWNGTQWSIVPSPNVGSFNNTLYGVTAISSSDVWAVGSYLNSKMHSQTLIEHWNGTSWQIIPSLNPGSTDNLLLSVAADSSSDVWAVGYYRSNGSPFKSLIERWNGSAWQMVPSPNPGSSGNLLMSVAAPSPGMAWAVGQYFNSSGPDRALIEQWNGNSWQVVASPKTGTSSNLLLGVAPTSKGVFTSAGFIESDSSPTQTLIEQWNGTSWMVIPSKNVGASDNKLFGVGAFSSSSAWAVGQYLDKGGNARTLIEQWNGQQWLPMASPSPGKSGDNLLGAVAALSANDVWAVGAYDNGGSIHTLIEHFC